VVTQDTGFHLSICVRLHLENGVFGNYGELADKWDEQVFRNGETVAMKKPTQHLIVEVLRSSSKVGMTIGIELGDVWSHYCTVNQDGEVVDRGRFRTTPASVDKWFTDLPHVRIAMEAGKHVPPAPRLGGADFLGSRLVLAEAPLAILQRLQESADWQFAALSLKLEILPASGNP
jgi:hypothetical protein